MRFRKTLTIAVLLLASACLVPPAYSHQTASWEDIFDFVIMQGGCWGGCHGAGQGGGLNVPQNNAIDWYYSLVSRPYRSGTSGGPAVGKLYVDPYKPWNSFLLDKLLGDLKLGDGDPMPRGGEGFASFCPGAVDDVTRWIKEGAPFNGYVEGDEPGITCDLPQPPLVPPSLPSDGVQLVTQSFTVARPDHEGEKTTAVAATNQAGFITRIVIEASAATEYVEVKRAGEEARLAVARGERLDLQLPAGVGIPVAAGQSFDVRQRIRNEYWTCAQRSVNGACVVPYKNQTQGIAYVNLTIAPSVEQQATPFVDATGSELLMVPPKSAATTGGAWPTAPEDAADAALVGVWADRRAMKVELLDAVGNKIAEGNDVTSGYVSVGAAGAPLAPVVYECLHGNGQNHRPAAPNDTAVFNPNEYYARTLDEEGLDGALKWGCEAQQVPSALPALVSDSTVRNCYNVATKYLSGATRPGARNDCAGLSPAAQCRPTSLVHGEGIDDGRCSLIGLKW